MQMSTVASTTCVKNDLFLPLASGRIASLDSLRGLAALSVVLWHIATMFPFSRNPWFAHTPLHIFGDGEEAVALFFALSGFVLMLPYMGPAPPRYRRFLKKRVLRLYPACWAVLTLSLTAYFIVGHHLPVGISPRRMPLWNAPPNPIAVAFQYY